MNKINNTIANIHTELLNIIGECMHYDLSGDQLSKISDKKQELIKKLFDFKDVIEREINEISKNNK